MVQGASNVRDVSRCYLGKAVGTGHVLAAKGRCGVWARQEGQRIKVTPSCDPCVSMQCHRDAIALPCLHRCPITRVPTCPHRPLHLACRYLSDHGNVRLLQSVRRTLRPGTRVASFYFPVAGWEQQLQHTSSTDGLKVFVYKAP